MRQALALALALPGQPTRTLEADQAAVAGRLILVVFHPAVLVVYLAVVVVEADTPTVQVELEQAPAVRAALAV